MHTFTFGESKFGIKVPPGWYVAQFVGTEDREPVKDTKFGKSNEPRLAWLFDVAEGEHQGQRIEQESGVTASSKSHCAKMLVGLHGRPLSAGEQVTVAQFVGKLYRVKVAPNPNSDKGNLYVADIEPQPQSDGAPVRPADQHPPGPPAAPPPPRRPAASASAPPTAPVAPPPPRRPAAPPEPPWSPNRRYWVASGDGAEPRLTDGPDLQTYIANTKLDPAAVFVCPEGQTEYRPASELGFRDAVPW